MLAEAGLPLDLACDPTDGGGGVDVSPVEQRESGASFPSQPVLKCADVFS